MSWRHPRECKSCGVMVVDLLHERTNKAAPIEAQSDPQGNISADFLQGSYRVLTGDQLGLARYHHLPLYLNHYARCPAAADWRARKATG